MTVKISPPNIELIPIDEIEVVNPRVRNQKVFRQIVDNISDVGLKKPITVTLSKSRDKEKRYDLICGQGRLEAFVELGQSDIPAFVINASKEDSMVMSLVENLARRQHQPIELLRDIGDLKKRGYNDNEIAKKTGLSYEYVHSIRHLLEEGEERLLVGVEAGQIPLSVAIDIAESDLEGGQEALAHAYEQGLLRGRKLLDAKRIVEFRQRQGKNYNRNSGRRSTTRLSSEALVHAYQMEADRQRLIIKRAEITQNRLLFIVQALRRLLDDDNFLTLLRAEKLETMPSLLADLIITRGQ